MVLLLNLIPWIILFGGGYLTYRYRKVWVFAATVVLLFLYFKAQPSYLPKGDIQRATIPEFTVPKTAEIEDRNRKCQQILQDRREALASKAKRRD
jgi:hypothetical protein